MGLPDVRQGQFWWDRPRRDGRDLLLNVLHSGFALIHIASCRPININSIDILAVLKGYTEEEAIERAGKVFESLDKNNDGGLAEDEFVKVSAENSEGYSCWQ